MREPIEEFLAEEEAKNLAPDTQRKRRTVMGWLDEWAEKDIQDFERSDIRDFLKYLQNGGHKENGLQPCDGTVSSYMAQVSGLFEFLVDERYIDADDNPREKIKYTDYLNYKTTEAKKALRGQGGNKEYIALKDDEPEKLLANATAPKVRNTLMMKLQLETGPRVGELVRVRLDDVDLEGGTVTYRTLKKDDVEWRTLQFGFGVKALMNKWLNEGYRGRFKSANDSPYVFVSRRAPKISESGYNEKVKEAAQKAGIQKRTRTDSNGKQEWKVRSHVLRHTYAESMVRNGCDISRLADLMGHESIETTRKYLDHDEEALRSAQREFSPDFSVGVDG
jgi:integrase/recombinase XerD